MQDHMLLLTRQSSTQNNKYQVSHKHSCFSWWCSHSRPKHVESDKILRINILRKNPAPSWFYLQDYFYILIIDKRTIPKKHRFIVKRDFAYSEGWKLMNMHVFWKSKLFLYTPWMHIGGVELWFHSFLTRWTWVFLHLVPAAVPLWRELPVPIEWETGLAQQTVKPPCINIFLPLTRFESQIVRPVV